MSSYEGRILEVQGDTFTAEVIDLSDDSTVHADFPLSVLSDDEHPEPGDIIDILVNGDIAVVKLRDFGRWTEAEISALKERAAVRAAEMRRLSD